MLILVVEENVALILKMNPSSPHSSSLFLYIITLLHSSLYSVLALFPQYQQYWKAIDESKDESPTYFIELPVRPQKSSFFYLFASYDKENQYFRGFFWKE